MRPHLLPPALLALAIAGGAAVAEAPLQSVGEAQDALRRASAEQRLAAARGARLEADAARAGEALERTAQEAAAVAARIQQAEAEIAAGEAQIVLIAREREALRARLAVQQAPLVRVTAALQLMSRRPLALALLRPGSLQDTVHMRAVLESILPVVQERTEAVRGEILRSRLLQRQAAVAQGQLRAAQGRLEERRTSLAALAARQRLASREARGVANREQDRAAALAERARDLGELMGQLATAGSLRDRLAALPGPVLRPDGARAPAVIALPSLPRSTGGIDYIMPVSGRLLVGFGEQSPDGVRSRGLTIAPREAAEVIAPAGGRVAFAGPFRGYGRILIIEHPGGWTTLVTNLATMVPRVGDELVQGAPLGQAGEGRPTVTVELRHDGTPVDILAALRG